MSDEQKPVDEIVTGASDDQAEKTVAKPDDVAGVPEAEPKTTKPKYSRILALRPILEKNDLKIGGSLHLPNNTRTEVLSWMEKFFAGLESKQAAREALSDSEREKKGYVFWEVPQNEGGSDGFWINQDEADVMGNLIASSRGLPPQFDTSTELLSGDDIETAPIYHESGKPIPLAIGNQRNNADPIAKIRQQLGLSITKTIPLWGSGFRIDVEGPTTADLLDLDMRITAEKVDIASGSFGFALTSYSIFKDRLLIDFLMDRVVKSTSGTIGKQDLLNRIALTDLDIITLGVASTIYPDGYPVDRSIFKDGNKEVRLEKRQVKLNISRMAGVRSSKFKDSELRRLSKSEAVYDYETLKAHRTGLRQDVDRYLPLNGTTLVKLQVPTLAEYLRIGLRYHTGLEKRAYEVLGKDESPEHRKIYMARMMEITRVMFMSHWVEGIYEKDEATDEYVPVPGLQRKDPVLHTEKEVEEADTSLELILEELSANMDICDKLVRGIDAFNNEMRLSFAMLPREHGTQVGEGEHPHVVIVDPSYLFFTLRLHKILQAGG